MSSKPAHKPQKPGTHGPGGSDREPPAAASGGSHALPALARLLGRQFALEFILQQQKTDSSLNEPPERDA